MTSYHGQLLSLTRWRCSGGSRSRSSGRSRRTRASILSILGTTVARTARNKCGPRFAAFGSESWDSAWGSSGRRLPRPLPWGARLGSGRKARLTNLRTRARMAATMRAPSSLIIFFMAMALWPECNGLKAQRSSLLPSGLDGEDEHDDPYKRWTALEDNWWQPFTDGFQHSANAVGKTPDGYYRPQVTWSGGLSTPAGDLVAVHRAYAEFFGNSSALSQAWDHDRLYMLSRTALGVDQLYTCHFPRNDEDRVKALAPGAVTNDPIFLAISAWEPPAPAGTAGCNFEHVSDAPSPLPPQPSPAAPRPTHPATPPSHALRSPPRRLALGQRLP